ncbi:hypothetical protein L1D31_19900 [Vibrio sp. Isolate23]|uniref:hypothetical protein n=1 Tax=unclassified Vibrio TaxID=2614977 RepID=UPI001EFE3AE7|nr:MULTISPECIES: hypothetical protein [unclassified Vibrio]MCG9680278.1 hypothetical protein [Vibrio sp. Isolate24]MCG9684799.1 hypothetical protein [Vibrio sp. Isolate23]
MIPYLTLVIAAIVFSTVLSLPWSNRIEDNRYQHSEIHIQPDNRVFRSDGLTRIENNQVVHLASLQDENMDQPIVIRFQGQAESFRQFGFSLSGIINLLSVQTLTPVMNDATISPYLLLNDDPYTLDIDILYSTDRFVIVRDRQTGRVQLLAKR